MKYNFRLFIPFGKDLDLLTKSVNSIADQVEEYSCYEGKKIVILNNSLEPINISTPYIDMIEIWELPFELVHAQQANWMIADSINKQLPFFIVTHTDAEHLPGVMKEMLSRYEKIKDTKWFQLRMAGCPVFIMFNPQFFVQENILYDAFLFPFYYMDHHIERIAKIRGWAKINDPIETPLVNHIRSHMLKTDDVFKARNDLVCVQAEKAYEEIWGGLPEKETINDPYAKGTLPR